MSYPPKPGEFGPPETHVHTLEQIASLAKLRPRPTWKCEYCGRFYSERTARAHGWCQQEEDRKNAEGMWPG